MQYTTFFSKKNNPRQLFDGLSRLLLKKSALLIADVLFLCRIEEQVADGSYKPVNSKGDHGQEDVRQRSRLEALGLERRVVDDQASDPAQKECQKKTHKILVFH